MRKMLIGFVSMVILTLSAGLIAEELPAAASPTEELPYKEGQHYTVLPAAKTAKAEDRNVVMEFFWYGCPHCSQFEPHVEKWLETKAEGVVFQRVPAPLNPNWSPHSKGFYAAEMMGELERFHEPLFAAIHGKRQKIATEAQVLDFAQKIGIDREAFAKAMNSFPVDTSVRRAKGLADKFNIRSVPVVIVSGKYRVDATTAGGYHNLLKIVDYLIAKETVVENP